jgi:hypothetical protein
MASMEQRSARFRQSTEMEAIMDARQDGIPLVNNTTGMAPRVQVVKHRHGLVLVVAIVSGTILFSSLQMLSVTGDMAGAGIAMQIPPTAQADARVDYFPAQYQNQSQNAQAEEHIQAF